MKRILLIEDNRDVLTYLTEILKDYGYECMGFRNGKDAVDAVDLFLPDLILCDIILPDIDGYEVFREIKKNPEFLKTPFVYLTALARKEDIRKGMDAGVDEYLTKPISPGQLINAVERRLIC